LLKRLTVFLAPALLVVIWEIWLGQPLAIVEAFCLTILVIALAIWYLTLRPLAVSQLQSSFHRREFWRFSLSPLFFVVAIFGFLVILESTWWQQVLVWLSAVVILATLQNLFDRFYRGASYSARSFEIISNNINTLSIFVLTTVLYSLIVFLNWAVYVVAILLLACCILLFYQSMWIAGLKLGQSWLFILIDSLVMIELFWVLNFLPNTFYIKALVLTVVYYSVINLSRNWLLKILQPEMIKRYLIVSLSILVLVLATAQWM